MNKHFCWFFLITLFCIKSAIARPFHGGWTIMQMNDFNRHSVHFHLSPSVNTWLMFGEKKNGSFMEHN